MDQVPSQKTRCFYFCGWRQSWGLEGSLRRWEAGILCFAFEHGTIGDSTRRKRKQEAFNFSLDIQESKRSKEKSNNTNCVYFRTKYRLFDYMKLLFRVSERIFTPPNEKSNTTLFLIKRAAFQSVRSTKIFTACKITKLTGATMQNMKTAQHSQTGVKINLQQ